MAELKLSGNHLKGSRPVLSFDAAFDEQPHLQLMKEMFTQAFATPRRHPKSKPFHDHVISFHFLDNRLWLRNYQVSMSSFGLPICFSSFSWRNMAGTVFIPCCNAYALFVYAAPFLLHSRL